MEGLTSTHTPTLTIRDGAITQIFHGVTISSKDPLDLINHDNHLHKSIRAISKRCFLNSSLQQTPDSKIKMPRSGILEMQVGQLVSIVSERKEGQLPSDTENNPTEQVNAITLKSGKIIREEPSKEQVEETPTQQEEKPKEETKGSSLKLNLDDVPPYIPYPKRLLKANLDK
ncbi:UNVERIFIED_CONTAM: hypothetical protein Slati_0474100 [Sesamum latifolium]|uniref:Uncharacterized protein n=1 Tax=Sesamum latifolium TaxID=2727402 RepID=A0AAW2XWT5_9LAMI